MSEPFNPRKWNPREWRERAEGVVVAMDDQIEHLRTHGSHPGGPGRDQAIRHCQARQDDYIRALVIAETITEGLWNIDQELTSLRQLLNLWPAQP